MFRPANDLPFPDSEDDFPQLEEPEETALALHNHSQFHYFPQLEDELYRELVTESDELELYPSPGPVLPPVCREDPLQRRSPSISQWEGCRIFLEP